ncbi:MAG: hypothetical protein WDA18_09320 [Candidatus Ratteibacteria bacterium]
MAWKEILDEEKIGIAGGLASLDSNQKLVQNVPNSKVDGLGSLALKSSLAAADIPNLAAGKITSGTFGADRIPTLPQSKITDLTTALNNKVDTTRKVNGKALSADVTLAASDVGARASTWTPAAADIPNLAASKITSGTFVEDRIPTLPQSKITNLTTALNNKVDTTRKVNGKALSADVTLGTNDLIASKTTLPVTGNEGEIIRFGSALYVWKG